MKKIIIILLLVISTLQISIADTSSDVEAYIEMIENGHFTQEEYNNYIEVTPIGDENVAFAKFLEAVLSLEKYDYAGAHTLLEDALYLLEDEESERLQAEVLYYLAEMDMFFSDMTTSVERSLQLREISQTINFTKGIIEADYNIAYSYIYNYDYEQGTEFATEAFELSLKSDYQNGYAEYYSFLGNLDYFNGDYASAISKFELALEEAETQTSNHIIEKANHKFRRILAYENVQNGDADLGLEYANNLIADTDPSNYYMLYMLEEVIGEYYSYEDPDVALRHYKNAYKYYLLSSIIESSYPYEVYLLEALGNMNYDIGNYQLSADYFYDYINFEYKNSDDEYGVMISELDDIKFEEINSKMTLLKQLNTSNEEHIRLSKQMVIYLTVGIIVLLVAVVVIIIEMRARSKTEKELYYTSITDSLTKVYNRGKIIDIFKANLNNKNAILLMDLDDFKNINDQYGHLFGDRVLVTISELVKSAIRDCDKIGRYGGEEFLVFLEKANQQEINEIAERIRKSIEEHVWEHADLKTTVSIGVTTCFSSDAEEVLHEADTLMYKAKNSGKNKIAFGY